MNRIRQHILRSASLLTCCSLLAGLSAAPCWGGTFALQQQVGSAHRIQTNDSFAPGSAVNWVFGPTFRLQGEVAVGLSRDQYETSPTTKLSVFQVPLPLPPLVLGDEASESRSVRDVFANYQSTATSTIKTDPIGLSGEIGGVELGVVGGVRATMEVQANIEPIDPQTNPVLFAQAFVFDPFPFANFAPEDVLLLTSALRTGDSFSVRADTDNLLNSLVVSTDIPGLETLYRLDILAAGTGTFTGTATDTTVHVRFAAHPLLSLSDTAITQAVRNSITFNDAAERFVVTSDVSLFTGAVQIPDHVRDFHLFITQSATSTNTLLALPPVSFGSPATPVPEPASLVLLLAGVGVGICLLVVRTRRERRAVRMGCTRPPPGDRHD
jgi:hypothetical protein